METLETEERMKECGSRGELGDVGVVAAAVEREIRTRRRAHKGVGGSTVRKSHDIGEGSVRYICIEAVSDKVMVY